jgi:hypothetical protein
MDEISWGHKRIRIEVVQEKNLKNKAVKEFAENLLLLRIFMRFCPSQISFMSKV